MNVRIASTCFCYICSTRSIPRGNHGLCDYTDTDIDGCLSGVTPDISRGVITGASHRRAARDGAGWHGWDRDWEGWDGSGEGREMDCRGSVKAETGLGFFCRRVAFGVMTMISCCHKDFSPRVTWSQKRKTKFEMFSMKLSLFGSNVQLAVQLLIPCSTVDGVTSRFTGSVTFRLKLDVFNNCIWQFIEHFQFERNWTGEIPWLVWQWSN